MNKKTLTWTIVGAAAVAAVAITYGVKHHNETLKLQKIAERTAQYENRVAEKERSPQDDLAIRTTFPGAEDRGDHMIKELKMLWFNEAVLQDAIAEGLIPDPQRERTDADVVKIWQEHYATNPERRAAFGQRMGRVYEIMAGWDYSSGVAPFGPGNTVFFFKPQFEVVQTRAAPDSLEALLQNVKRSVNSIPLPEWELRGPYWPDISPELERSMIEGVRQFYRANPQFAPKPSPVESVSWGAVRAGFHLDAETTPAVEDTTQGTSWTTIKTGQYPPEEYPTSPLRTPPTTPASPVTPGWIATAPGTVIPGAEQHTRGGERMPYMGIDFELAPSSEGGILASSGRIGFRYPVLDNDTHVVASVGREENQWVGGMSLERIFKALMRHQTGYYAGKAQVGLVGMGRASYIDDALHPEAGATLRVVIPGFGLDGGALYDFKTEEVKPLLRATFLPGHNGGRVVYK